MLLGYIAHALWPTMHSCLFPRRSRGRQLPRQDQHLKYFPRTTQHQQSQPSKEKVFSRARY